MDLVEQGIRESGHSLRKSAADSHLNRFDVLWWRRAGSWLAILSCCIVGIITVICCVARPESRSLEKSDLRAAIAWSEPDEVSLGAEVGRLVRLDSDHFKHARCLDGSQAAYYWRPGSRATSWLVFLEGGGFCSTWAECVARAATDLGSSKGYKQTMTFTEPYLSLNVSDNPLLHDWGVVYAKYCDGAYFAGRAGEVADPQTGSKLHFAGEHILKAVVEDMASRAKGFRTATEVIVAGCSAGGIAVLNQMDGIKRLFQARLPKAKQIYGFADSGFYLAKPMYIEPKRFVIEAQHGGGLLPPKCLQDHSDSPWLCLVGEVGTQYLQTPVFMWETRYDEDHQMCEMDAACRANATCIET